MRRPYVICNKLPTVRKVESLDVFDRFFLFMQRAVWNGPTTIACFALSGGGFVIFAAPGGCRGGTPRLRRSLHSGFRGAAIRLPNRRARQHWPLARLCNFDGRKNQNRAAVAIIEAARQRISGQDRFVFGGRIGLPVGGGKNVISWLLFPKEVLEGCPGIERL